MEKGANALLTDERGFITEGTGTNFFIARNGENPHAQTARYPAWRLPGGLHGPRCQTEHSCL